MPTCNCSKCAFITAIMCCCRESIFSIECLIWS